MNLPELPWILNERPIDGYARGYAVICAQAAREQAATIAESWAEPSTLRLHAGEMTAQEMRTAQAVARGIAAAIREGK